MREKKYLLREYYSLCPDGVCDISLLTEEEKKYRDKGFYILTGILSTADQKNGNGRIYPKRVLEREIENYQKAIREQRSVGECVESGSEILTIDGWKKFENIRDDEYIYTLNVETNIIEVQRIDEKIEKDFNGKLLHFYGKNIDIKVTPKHQFFLVDRYGKKIVAVAEDIFKNRKKYSHSYIPKTGEWSGISEEKEYFILNSGIPIKSSLELKEKYGKNLEIDLYTWSAFLGFYLAEGCCEDRKNKGYRVMIYQNEGEKAEEFRKILNDFPKEIVWRERKRINISGKENVIFYTSDLRLCNYLKTLGNKYNKFIPKEIKMLSPKYLEILYEWFLKGDGRTRKCHNNTCVAKEIFSVSKRLMEDFQEILLKIGYSGNITKREPKDVYINGREIKKENCKDLYLLHLSTTKGVYLDERFLSIKEVDYEGKVYCVRVKNETFFCKNKEKLFISHNCDHSDENVINLKNVSHMIVRTWWDGNNVWGVVKVLKTPSGKIIEGLIESGVRLGISSRALGSVTETNQGTIVGEDLVLLCFDIVSEPSNLGSYLMMKETQEKHILSKEDRIYRLLNDITRRE